MKMENMMLLPKLLNWKRKIIVGWTWNYPRDWIVLNFY